MGTWGFSDLLRTLDPRPEVRFREFERICRWYLLNAPEYRSRIGNVWLWSDWPGAWGRDAGVDLIAEECDGGLWAVQAKLYDPAYAIKKADVDSFLSESARYDFAHRLLIATTDHLGPTACKTLDSQRQPVGYLLRSQIELAPVAWPASAADLRPRRPARKKPLPHVREAIDETVTGFAEQERRQLIMACGTGKTLAGLWIAERLGSSRTLVLVPSLSLLAHTLREWSANASGAFDYLAVCSDETVVGEDELVQHTSELGLPVTTSPEAIAAFLRRRGRRVVFATYQSSPQMAAAYRSRTPAFDLAIADEAHRCAGRVGGEFATILDAERIRARRRLFMTATPRYYTPRLRHEAGLLDVEVASMDDESVSGPVLHRLTFGDAIARDLLSDYQVVVVGVDDETFRAWAERGELVTRDGSKITDARTLAGQIGLLKAARKYRLRRVISFHGRVKAAREFSAEVPDVVAWMPARARPAGALWSEHVSGAMTSGRRDRLLMRFRSLAAGEWGLLSNARCLGEGVDVPTIDGIAFIDPRRSTIDIVQAVGRAIRKAPDKRVGTIVLPVFIADDDPDRALNDSTFKSVWDVLKALRAHDENLGKELDELRRALGRQASPPPRPGKIKLDIPAARVGEAFAEAFNTRLVEQTSATWEFWFGVLLAYVSRTGDSRVPTHYIGASGYKLGQWVASQRSSHNRGELLDARARQLADLSGWTWHTHRDAWEDGYERLCRFVAREGHADVPKGFVDQDGSRLDLWVLHQRDDFRRGKLSSEQARRLDEIEGWTWDPGEAAFNHGLDRLRGYVERHGNASVSNDYIDEDGFKLGLWVANRRKGYKDGHLAASSIAALEAVPEWSWSLEGDAWEKGYERLRGFIDTHGHSRVHKDYRDRYGYKLGSWVSNQRHNYATGRLAPERVARLDATDGWLWATSGPRRRPPWEQSYNKLRRYVEAHGDARVPLDYVDEEGFRLGVWCAGRRTHRDDPGDRLRARVIQLERLLFLQDRDRVGAASLVDRDLVVAQPRVRSRRVGRVAVPADLPQLRGRDPLVGEHFGEQARQPDRVVLSVVPDRPEARAVVLDRFRELAPVAAVELRCLVDEDHRLRVDGERTGGQPDLELLDGQRGRFAGELLGHPPGGGAVHRAREHPPPGCPVGLRRGVQRRPLAGPRPARETRPTRAAGQQLERRALLPIQTLAFAERRLGSRQAGPPLPVPERRIVASAPRRADGDVDHVPLELADLARGDPAAGERQQLAALRALHPRQQPRGLVSRQAAGRGLEHERARLTVGPWSRSCASTTRRASASAPRRRRRGLPAGEACCPSQGRNRAPARPRPRPGAAARGRDHAAWPGASPSPAPPALHPAT